MGQILWIEKKLKNQVTDVRNALCWMRGDWKLNFQIREASPLSDTSCRDKVHIAFGNFESILLLFVLFVPPSSASTCWESIFDSLKTSQLCSFLHFNQSNLDFFSSMLNPTFTTAYQTQHWYPVVNVRPNIDNSFIDNESDQSKFIIGEKFLPFDVCFIIMGRNFTPMMKGYTTQVAVLRIPTIGG